MVLIGVILDIIRQVIIIEVFDSDGCNMVVDQQLETSVGKGRIVFCRIEGCDDKFSPGKVFDDVQIFLPLKIAGTVNVVMQTAPAGCDAEIL